MKVGVKFCGGCNPKYDRGESLRKLKEERKDILWIIGNTDEICDYWLLICGCQRGCIRPEDFTASKEILKLESPMDFVKAKQQIENAMEEETKDQIKTVYRNDQAVLKKVITAQDVKDFAKITLDYNKIHTNPVFCEKTQFQQPIAHGMLSLSLLSSVMGMKLPGEGTVLMGCNTKFVKPVFIGDELTATVTLTKCRDFGEYYIAELEGTVTNQQNEIVTKMTANQMMSKQFFILKENKKENKQ